MNFINSLITHELSFHCAVVLGAQLWEKRDRVLPLQDLQSHIADKKEWNNHRTCTSALVINMIYKGKLWPGPLCNEAPPRRWCLNWVLKGDRRHWAKMRDRARRAEWAAGAEATQWEEPRKEGTLQEERRGSECRSWWVGPMLELQMRHLRLLLFERYNTKEPELEWIL